MLSFTEENYLKAIIQHTVFAKTQEVGVKELAQELTVKPATVSDMLKKLKDKDLVNYEKYGKISLSKLGQFNALMVIRRHRLWETFLHDKLNFNWDEVHEVAEELEHIQSIKLIDRLDDFLGNPVVDPHGDAIPDRKGNIENLYYDCLCEMKAGSTVTIKVVKDNSRDFLKYALKTGLILNQEIYIIDIEPFDGMMTIQVNDEVKSISKKVSESILVERI